VDLQDQNALELANVVATKVKEHARPWRAIIATILAIGAGSVAHAASRGLSSLLGHGHLTARLIWGSATLACCFFILVAVVGLAGKTRRFLTPRAGTGHAAVVRYSTMLLGAIITFIVLLGLLKIPVTQLLVGGAVTTIFIGIAAQQSLGNVFAGIVLLFSRPFAVGDTVVLRSGALSGPIQGVVVEIGITYVRLETGDGVMYLPNSQVLAAGVGHIRPAMPQPPTAEPTEREPVTPREPIPETPMAQTSAHANDGARANGAPGDGPPAAGQTVVGQTGNGPASHGQPASGSQPASDSQPEGTPPGGSGAPSGDAPGSGGRPLSPPGL
jgi:hypothetical protein